MNETEKYAEMRERMFQEAAIEDGHRGNGQRGDNRVISAAEFEKFEKLAKAVKTHIRSTLTQAEGTTWWDLRQALLALDKKPDPPLDHLPEFVREVPEMSDDGSTLTQAAPKSSSDGKWEYNFEGGVNSRQLLIYVRGLEKQIEAIVELFKD